MAQTPVGGVAFFCLREIARAGQPVDGGVGEDDAQRPLTAFFQQGGKLPDVMLILVEPKENEQIRQGFFPVLFQTAGTAGSGGFVRLLQDRSAFLWGMSWFYDSMAGRCRQPNFLH